MYIGIKNSHTFIINIDVNNTRSKELIKKMLKSIFLYIGLFGCISNLYAEKNDVEAYISVSKFIEHGGRHSGVEVSHLVNFNSYLAGRTSGVRFTENEAAEYGKSDAATGDGEIYKGVSLSLYIHIDSQHITPYFGYGAFHGETTDCSDEKQKDGTCDEGHILSYYPEVGVALNVKRLHVYVFGRRYVDTNLHENKINAYGVHLGFRL